MTALCSQSRVQSAVVIGSYSLPACGTVPGDRGKAHRPREQRSAVERWMWASPVNTRALSQLASYWLLRPFALPKPERCENAVVIGSLTLQLAYVSELIFGQSAIFRTVTCLRLDLRGIP